VTAFPRCNFAVRYPAGDDTWRYQGVDVPTPGGGGFSEMEHPPPTGALVLLYDRSGRLDGGPYFRVVDQLWSYPAWGSVTWPYGAASPQQGPLVDIIVEPAGSPYKDEAPTCADLECPAVWVNGAWWMPPGEDEAGPHEHRPYERGESS
jgi:hypothetical protein